MDAHRARVGHVDDYDSAISFYVQALGFELVEDSPSPTTMTLPHEYALLVMESSLFDQQKIPNQKGVFAETIDRATQERMLRASARSGRDDFRRRG